jgi:metal-dependent HD superfamily phosphatase/phosphodiesterase
MNAELNTITINGKEYVEKGSLVADAERLNGLTYKIVRTLSAGVFAGYVSEVNGDNVKMIRARRLWYWSGAASLSQLAMEGVKYSDKCKFPCEVNVELFNVIEILDVTEVARKNIAEVPVWKQ